MKKILTPGIIFACIAAIISGFSVFYNKIAVTNSIDPWVASFIKNSSVAIILFSLFSLKPTHPISQKIRLPHIVLLLYIGIIGGGVAFLLFFSGLSSVGATQSALLHKTQFIWITIFSIFFLSERITLLHVVSYSALIWSTVVIGAIEPFLWTTHHSFILLATILWSLEALAIRHVSHVMPSQKIAFIRMALGSFVIFIALIISGKLALLRELSLNDYFVLFGAVLLLFGYVVSWTRSLQLIPATTVSVLLALSIPITSLLSAIFISHTLTQVQIIKIIISLLSISACIGADYYIQKIGTKNNNEPAIK